jgi:hypothetical protein
VRYEKFGMLYGQLERLGVLHGNHIYPVRRDSIEDHYEKNTCFAVDWLAYINLL